MDGSFRSVSVSKSEHGSPVGEFNNYVYVKLLTGEILMVFAELSDTIQAVKQKIKDIKNCSLDQQRLVFKGKALSNLYSLKEYNVPMGSVLHLLHPLWEV